MLLLLVISVSIFFRMANKTSGSRYWQDGKSLADCMKHAFTHGMAADVKFSISQTIHGGSRVSKFSVHKLILALMSPVFQTMFYGNLPENGSTIVVKDVTPDAFQGMLRYLVTYTVKDFLNVMELNLALIQAS